MKIIKQIAFLLCAGLILFGSCKKSVPPQLRAVPATATFVVALETGKLIRKGGLDKPEDYKVFQKLLAEDPTITNAVAKFLANPAAYGLNIEQAYVFGKVPEDAGMAAALTAGVADVAALEAELLKELGSDAKIEDKGTYKTIVDPESIFTLAWNSELFIAVTNTGAGTLNTEEYFNMPEEKSIMSVPDFVEFQKRSYDIGFWMSYKVLGDVYKDMLHINVPEIYKTMLSDAFIHAYVNFENGEMKISGLMSPESEVDAIMEKYPIIKKDFDAVLLRDFPEKTYMAIKLAINVQEYFKLLADMSEQMEGPDVVSDMMQNNPTVNAVVNALGGDMLMSLYGFAQGPMPIPLAGIGFTVKSKEDFDKLLALIPAGTVKSSGDHYVISAGFVSIYFAYKDNRVLITDDADAIASFTGKGYDKNLTNNPLAGVLKTSPNLVYFDLDIDNYPENIRTLLQKESFGATSAFLTAIRPYKDISCYTVDKYEGVFSVKMKDTSRNALKQILESLDALADSEDLLN